MYLEFAKYWLKLSLYIFFQFVTIWPMVWNVLCSVVIVAMAKPVTTTTAPVGATVMQGYKVTGVRTVSIYVLVILLLEKEIDKYLDLSEKHFWCLYMYLNKCLEYLWGKHLRIFEVTASKKNKINKNEEYYILKVIHGKQHFYYEFI